MTHPALTEDEQTEIVFTGDKQGIHDSVDMLFAKFLMLEDVVHDRALRSDIATGLRKIAEKFERAV